MKTIETVVNVTSERQITVQLPPDIPTGEYDIVIVINESVKSEKLAAKNKIQTLKSSAYPVGLVADNFTFRREDLYDR
ncbi:hypothetical protein IQ231_12005 [Cuspidothrix issatschenkoi LEGE 03284]|uniref:hypothetical protein n=1 Tax=Cuspidothrix issatschenkoi TaxID=230752 RepID=UPI00187F4817|nr:hypothetical protein [Cuspidothrix issatschenkoi]MBE9232380.1 hypothetical protein [Cuspidothrix issatschenkoi LEGE 03284]